MSDALTIPACARCGHAVWPPRSLCPVCGSPDWTPLAAADGVVEERTTVTAPDGTTAILGSVRLAAGPVVVARAAEAAPGEAVHVTLRDGALTATAVPGDPAQA